MWTRYRGWPDVVFTGELSLRIRAADFADTARQSRRGLLAVTCASVEIVRVIRAIRGNNDPLTDRASNPDVANIRPNRGCGTV